MDQCDWYIYPHFVEFQTVNVGWIHTNPIGFRHVEKDKRHHCFFVDCTLWWFISPQWSVVGTQRFLKNNPDLLGGIGESNLTWLIFFTWVGEKNTTEILFLAIYRCYIYYIPQFVTGFWAHRLSNGLVQTSLPLKVFTAAGDVCTWLGMKRSKVMFFVRK